MISDIALGFVSFFSGMGLLMAYLHLTRKARGVNDGKSASAAASENDAARTMMARTADSRSSGKHGV
jgi:hypothetical protein